MAAKEEAKENAAEEAAKADEGAAPKASGGLKAWLPAILALVLSPAACWAVAQFVLLPKLEARLSEAAGHDAHGASTPAPAAHGAPAKHGAPGAAAESYQFSDVVVNLAGTMGTRYLKCSFVVTGAEPGIKATFEGSKAQLTDVTLNILSSLTLAELEQPGARNILRERLVATYNQTIGRRVAEQVYFSDFVIQ